MWPRLRGKAESGNPDSGSLLQLISAFSFPLSAFPSIPHSSAAASRESAPTSSGGSSTCARFPQLRIQRSTSSRLPSSIRISTPPPGSGLICCERVPLALAHQLPRQRVEPDAHRVMPMPGEHPETLAQVLVDREIRRPVEPRRRPPHPPHPRHHKSPDLPARQVESEQIPLVRYTPQVVRPHAALLISGALRLLVLELDLARLQHRLAHTFELIDVRRRGPDARGMRSPSPHPPTGNRSYRAAPR